MKKVQGSFAEYVLDEKSYPETLNKLRRRVRDIRRTSDDVDVLLVSAKEVESTNRIEFLIWYRESFMRIFVLKSKEKAFRSLLPSFLKIEKDLTPGYGVVYSSCSEICKHCLAPMVLASMSQENVFVRCIRCGHLALAE